MAKVCVGIDLGGTYIKLAAMGEDKRICESLQVSTPAVGGKAVVAAMADGVRNLLKLRNLSEDDVVGVGIGSPGPLSRSTGIVADAPNIKGFRKLPLRDMLSENLGMPATLENDANAAAFGEYLCGAGSCVNSMVMLTLGTGVGGGVVIDGRVWHGAHDFAGEVGHMVVQPDGLLCGCGQRGCLEQYASATYLARQAEEAIRQGRQSTLEQVVVKNGALDAADVNAARKAGDALAAEVWDSATYHLAIACVNLQRLLDCELIVLAGGLTKAGQDLMAPLDEHFSKLDWKLTDRMSRLVIAELGNDAGVIGAAGVAWQELGQQ